MDPAAASSHVVRGLRRPRPGHAGAGPAEEDLLHDLVDGIQGRLSLESAILTERARALRIEERKLASQRAFLRAERRRARSEQRAIAEAKDELSSMKREDWFPDRAIFSGNQRRYRLNVGGRVFEVSEHILKRDKNSLLAAICSEDCPLSAANDGDEAVYVDRDWWTFRYVLIFLRDHLLPRDRELLTSLYREAGFWRVESLRRAIEERQLNLYRTNITVQDDGTVDVAKRTDKEGWWDKPPSWWTAPKKDAKKKKKDFWESDPNGFAGHQYWLSTDPEQVTTNKKEDKMAMTQTTWAAVGGGPGGWRGSSYY